MQYQIIDRQSGKLLTSASSISQAINFLETEKPKDCEIKAVPARSQRAKDHNHREVCHGF